MTFPKRKYIRLEHLGCQGMVCVGGAEIVPRMWAVDSWGSPEPILSPLSGEGDHTSGHSDSIMSQQAQNRGTAYSCLQPHPPASCSPSPPSVTWPWALKDQDWEEVWGRLGIKGLGPCLPLTCCVTLTREEVFRERTVSRAFWNLAKRYLGSWRNCPLKAANSFLILNEVEIWIHSAFVQQKSLDKSFVIKTESKYSLGVCPLELTILERVMVWQCARPFARPSWWSREVGVSIETKAQGVPESTRLARDRPWTSTCAARLGADRLPASSA